MLGRLRPSRSTQPRAKFYLYNNLKQQRGGEARRGESSRVAVGAEGEARDAVGEACSRISLSCVDAARGQDAFFFILGNCSFSVGAGAAPFIYRFVGDHRFRHRNSRLTRNRRYRLMARPGKMETSMGYGNWCIFGLLLGLAQLLLHGALGLVLFWVIYYRGGFGWRDTPQLEFNYHPVLMIAGFIYLVGNALLTYRSYRCCQHRIYNKLFHTIFHVLAVPCIVMGFLTVLDSHNLRKPEPVPNFYSLHSWIGLATMGLFALQIVVGFFSFLILLCCEASTAAFRAALVPVHATFGLITFLMAIATAVTGLTEKALFVFNGTDGQQYHDFPAEGLVVNVLGAILVALAVLVPILLLIFRRPSSTVCPLTTEMQTNGAGQIADESERL